jgi:hypothetical protein
MYMALGVFSVEVIDGHWCLALLKIDTIFKALRSSYVLGSCYLPGVIGEESLQMEQDLCLTAALQIVSLPKLV